MLAFNVSAVSPQTSFPRFTDPSSCTETISEQSIYFHVPGYQVQNFVGRETQLRAILSHFSAESDRQPRILILYGLGGLGKTQIALEYCRRSREAYRGVFWINASSETKATQSFEGIMANLCLGSPSDPDDADANISRVKSVLESWDERWLLVIDNFDEPEAFPSVQRFIPSST
jgi:Cdc6-like AAA superfamily ATPase